VRLGDLLREVRREQRPLQRQAEAARRHDGLVAELRTLRAFQAGRELAELERRSASVAEQQRRVAERTVEVEGQLRGLDEVIEVSDTASATRRSGDARVVATRVEALLQRSVGLGKLVSERRRAVAAELAVDSGQAVGLLEADRAQLAGAVVEAEAEAEALGPAWEALSSSEAELASERLAAAPAPLQSPSPPAGSSGNLPAARASAAEHRRALALSREALARITERGSSLRTRREELDNRLVAGDEALAVAARSLDEATSAAASDAALLGAAVEAETAAAGSMQTAEQERHASVARAETLASALDEARARAGVERLAGVDGVLGALHDLVEIDPGYESAFEAAAEGALEAVVMDGVASARVALDALRHGGGGAVIAARDRVRQPSSRPEAPGADLVWLRDHVRSPHAEVSVLLDQLFESVLCCAAGFAAALEVALDEAAPGRTVVTTGGDRFGARGWKVGGGWSGATRASVDRALAEAEAVGTRAEEASSVAHEAASAAGAARKAAAASASDVAKLEAELTRLTASREQDLVQLASLEPALVASEAERVECEQRVESHGEQLSEAESLVAELEAAESVHAERASAERAALAAFDERRRELAGQRSDLEVRAAALDERRSMLARRLAEVDERLAAYATERIAAEVRRSGLETSAVALARLQTRLGGVQELLQEELAGAMRAADVASVAADDAAAGVAAARRDRAELEKELVEARERDRRFGIEDAEIRLRLQTSVETLGRDLDVTPEEALAVPRPQLPDGVTPAARARELDRELRLLGPVNPLAEEELSALVERAEFLDRELEDVRAARRELGRVIRAIDAEIGTVFEAAFADVSGHFEVLVETLFPGGSGRLTLTPAESPLDTGVEIEARPAGRQMRRLSLLSGGERSLVALAFLFAVFRSRPSPFYLMDEVEAALDDINLHRFLDLLDEFRNEAQLIIVSHQKRTMEAADALYGVTMAPGGTSKVISERVRT
jgi:chromosome segregation protein